ncbi:MAG: class I SAM-dependent methyltransferase [Caulobacterales bacterium]|uniref:class I SAM-dependent methyltransferase n=1 Tax=Glycocaulis sp. TaxID=1969725 RepID=UPI003FA02583
MTDASLSSFDPALSLRACRETISRLRGVPRLFKAGLTLLLKFGTGSLTVILPDGRSLHFQGANPGPDATMQVHDYAMVRRVFAGGDVGFAESYMAGQWSTPDLANVLQVFSANLDNTKDIEKGRPLTRLAHWIWHRLRANTRSQARKNIEAHYDLGNDFYELWLDPTMTYSAARFTAPELGLEAAQTEKYGSLARLIGLERGMHVLEIGCGWGGFAEYAAGTVGARVTCLTLSPAQRDYAIARMERAGLSEAVEIKLQDYRDETGQYDAVASIEMFEAVGEEYWPAYFAKVREVLKPGGKAGLQIITIRDDLFDSYRKRADFIQRYIFPGGILPSVERLDGEFAKADLRLNTREMFGIDYADTLAWWMERFQDAWPRVEPMGFDTRFRRMWEFYLAYCEAGFRTGRIDVGQFVLERS